MKAAGPVLWPAPIRWALLLLASISVACGDDYVGYLPPEGTPVHRLVGSEVIVPTDAIRGVATRISVDGGWLVLGDIWAESLIVVMRDDGTLIRRLGHRGEGPGELKDVSQLDIMGDTLWVYDFAQTRLSRVDLADPDGELEPVLGFGAGSGRITQIHPYGNGYVATGRRMNLLGRWDATDSVVSWRGRHPELVRKEGDRWRGSVSTSFSALDRRTGRIAIGYQLTGEFLIADSNTGETLVETRVGNWPVRWVELSKEEYRTKYLSDESIFGYVSVKNAGPYVAALFVGKPYGEAQLDHSLDARDIQYFDWDGNLLWIDRLDRPIVDFAVAGDIVYGVVAEPVPEVRRWRRSATGHPDS